MKYSNFKLVASTKIDYCDRFKATVTETGWFGTKEREIYGYSSWIYADTGKPCSNKIDLLIAVYIAKHMKDLPTIAKKQGL